MNTVFDRRVVELLTEGVTLHQAGRLVEAGCLYEKVLAIHPRQADALHLLGVIAHQQRRFDEAVERIERAIAADPGRWAFYSNLGCAQQELGRPAAAQESYLRAIQLGGESAALLSNLGTAYQDAGQLQAAERCFRRSLELDANHAEAHYNLGNLLRQQGRPDLAIGCYESALRCRPNYAEAHVNLANILQDQGKLDEAIRSYQFAIEVDSRHAEAHYNLGRALLAVGNNAEALLATERALELDQQHAKAHRLRGTILLATGRFEEGWREFAWRWRVKGAPELRKLSQPLWTGQSLAGKSILAYSEPIFEDELWFGYCLPELVGTAGHCIIECDPRLVPLYRRSFASATIQPRTGWEDCSWLERVGPIDYQLPIGNAAGYFFAEGAGFPKRRGHLVADAGLVKKWRERFASLGSGLKIGISWLGANDRENRRNLQIPLNLWRPLWELKGVHFVNLQQGAVADEIERIERQFNIVFHDWEDCDPGRDLDGLAAEMRALDVVIAPGNMQAILAGAVGARVWTLLPRHVHWRWMLEGVSTPWFATMRLMRQREEGDWQELFERVRDSVRLWQRQTDLALGGDDASPSCAVAAVTTIARSDELSRLNRRRATISDSRWQLNNASVPEAFETALRFQTAGESHHAEGILREILRQVPKHADALHRLGCLLRGGGRHEEGVGYLREAAEVGSARLEFHFDLAVALTEMRRDEEAERELWRVIELDPNQGPAYVNLGVIYERLGKLDEALSICRRGLALMPESPQAHYNLANVYLHQGFVEKALGYYDRVIALDPKFHRGYWNRGLAHLLLGNFAEGWKGYQYRELAEQVRLNRFSLPEWDGSDLTGKTLLIHAEQGVGDEIMFNTCVPEMVRRAGHVHLSCDPRLKHLFARSFSGVSVHAVVRGPTFNWEPPAGIDVYTHAGTLPFYLRPDWESFPRQERFLKADAALVEKWRRRFARLGPGPKVGISWRAGGLSSEQRRRTSPLDHWQPVFQLPGFHFINLQYGNWADEIAAAKSRFGVTIHDWQDADPLSDLENFAAEIEALDAVVSVGNTTIHMAGALGVPTWTVLPRVPGWRYLLHGDWLPWYASVRLRRQRERSDWDEVYRRVAGELQGHFHPRSPVWTRSFDANDFAAEENGGTTTRAELSTDGDLSQDFLAALKQHRAGQLEPAEARYRTILMRDPRHAEALHLLGLIAHQTKRLDSAIELIGQAIAIDGANSVYHYNYANALRDAGRFDEAIDQLRRAVELNPHLAEAHLNLGALLQSQGKPEEAIVAYEQALVARPDYAEAHNNLGSALRALGRYEWAGARFEEAVKLRPDYADAQFNLGDVLAKLGRVSAAVAAFDRGLALRPQHATARARRDELARVIESQCKRGLRGPHATFPSQTYLSEESR